MPTPPPDPNPRSAEKKTTKAFLLAVQVQPRAAREEIVGLHAGRLKIALHAPPVEGAANVALCAFLAREFHVAKGEVAVIKGEKARTKTVRITGATDDLLHRFRQRWGL
ncbi:MAG: YggU family protein [Magnetococcales bacterium]|nr:YggU family protein [Magnetococcales bacterium]